VERPNLQQTYVPMYVAGPNQDAALIAAAPALLRQLADGWGREREQREQWQDQFCAVVEAKTTIVQQRNRARAKCEAAEQDADALANAMVLVEAFLSPELLPNPFALPASAVARVERARALINKETQ
jgi:hypothetical protein